MMDKFIENHMDKVFDNVTKILVTLSIIGIVIVGVRNLFW